MTPTPSFESMASCGLSAVDFLESMMNYQRGEDAEIILERAAGDYESAAATAFNLAFMLTHTVSLEMREEYLGLWRTYFLKKMGEYK